jgi:hypothetical protein
MTGDKSAPIFNPDIHLRSLSTAWTVQIAELIVIPRKSA